MSEPSEIMEAFPEEMEIDYTFTVRSYIYEALENTISNAIDMEMQKGRPDPGVLTKEKILANVLEQNFKTLENDCFLTTGPDKKVYVCGQWLFRPVLWEGNMIPMMEYLKLRIGPNQENIVFIPTESGAIVRKRLWNS